MIKPMREEMYIIWKIPVVILKGGFFSSKKIEGFCAFTEDRHLLIWKTGGDLGLMEILYSGELKSFQIGSIQKSKVELVLVKPGFLYDSKETIKF